MIKLSWRNACVSIQPIRIKENKDILNFPVKFGEAFRPFAPAVL